MNGYNYFKIKYEIPNYKNQKYEKNEIIIKIKGTLSELFVKNKFDSATIEEITEKEFNKLKKKYKK
jgi:hypothetical protein